MNIRRARAARRAGVQLGPSARGHPRAKAIKRLQEVGIKSTRVPRSCRVSYPKVSQAVRIVANWPDGLIGTAASALEQQPKLPQVDVNEATTTQASFVVPRPNLLVTEQFTVTTEVAGSLSRFVSPGEADGLPGGHATCQGPLSMSNVRTVGETPVLGFEPRSEAPQASRIIQCSGARLAPHSRSYPTRASGSFSPRGAPRSASYKRAGRARSRADHS